MQTAITSEKFDMKTEDTVQPHGLSRFYQFYSFCIHFSAQPQLSPFFIHEFTTDIMPLPTHMNLNPSGTALVMKF